MASKRAQLEHDHAAAKTRLIHTIAALYAVPTDWGSDTDGPQQAKLVTRYLQSLETPRLTTTALRHSLALYTTIADQLDRALAAMLRIERTLKAGPEAFTWKGRPARKSRR